ncbi:hypothetical protein HPC49_10075 [Pyxidicoccus fallax]|uniref:Lipoprotein n=1 Tax=Pyxidicoccus fallax TaxID=394095 RepID=A0A848LK60_9BACT|nr:hypothetical protein [Pyxidicoccus fallax]NMO18083.1 hypothetical protein [Pyxidicoccus fallax]NPC78589.1 hypothetical protein [Pyxidicoccus fallax]
MRKLVLLMLCGLWLGCQSESSEKASRDAGDGDASVEAECVRAEAPTCCLGCEDVLTEPVCTDGKWTCPEGSTDQRQCPSRPGLPACSGASPSHPQQTYTYPGCENADYNCPRLLTVYCALESIRAEHNQCEQDRDCVAAEFDARCTDHGQCPPAMVSVTGRADFETKAAAEVARYCGDPPICAARGSCSVEYFVPRCKQGRCVADWPDAGT